MTRFLPLALVAALGLTACDNPNTRDQVGAGVAGGAIAAIAATALGANDAWTVAAGAAGAAAGTLYARNRQAEPDQCAYHTGDGETVTVRPCP